MKRHSFLLLSVFLLLFSSACQKRLQGTAEGIDGRKDAPKSALSLESMRVRCGTEKPVVKCRLLTNVDGSESTIESLPPTITANWEAPVASKGTLSKASCQILDGGLSQECTIEHSGNETLTLSFSVNLNDLSSGKSKIEKETVLYDFTVASIGALPQFPSFQRIKDKLSGSTAEGFQLNEFDPKLLSLGPISSFCYVGEKIYFIAGNQIYTYQNEKAKLYSTKFKLGNASNSMTVGVLNLSIDCGKSDFYVSDTLNRRVIKYQPNGEAQELSGFIRPSGVAEKADGSVIVMDEGTNQLIEIAANGSRRIILGGLACPMRPRLHSDGSVYFLERVGTQGGLACGNKLRKLHTSGQLVDIAGGFARATDFLLESDGSIFVADYGSNRLLKITQPGKFETHIGFPTDCNLFPYKFEEEMGIRSACLKGPSSLARDPFGRLLFGEIEGQKLRVIKPDNRIISLVGALTNYAFSADVNKHTFSNLIKGLTFIEDGSLLVSDLGRQLGSKVTPDGAMSIFTAPDEAVKSQLAFAFTVRSAGPVLQLSNGSILIADAWRSYLRKLNPDGTDEYIFQIVGVTGLALGQDGSIFVSSTNSNSIIKITPKPRIGTQTGVDWIPSTYVSNLNSPKGIALSPDGTLYVVESGSNQIRRIRPQGMNEALPISIPLNAPTGLALNRNRLYVADSGNNQVQVINLEKVNTLGQFESTVLFGNKSQGDCGVGTVEGKATAEELQNQMQSSLSVLCSGKPQEVAVLDRCQSEEKRIDLAIAQSFSNVGNIVKISMPCH